MRWKFFILRRWLGKPFIMNCITKKNCALVNLSKHPLNQLKNIYTVFPHIVESIWGNQAKEFLGAILKERDINNTLWMAPRIIWINDGVICSLNVMHAHCTLHPFHWTFNRNLFFTLKMFTIFPITLSAQINRKIDLINFEGNNDIWK